MKVIAAIDSLKGSLSSCEAGEAVRRGILNSMPGAEVLVKPVADGGEGTAESLILGMNGQRRKVTVTGPLGRRTEAVYGIVEEHTAVLEMAMAAGLMLVPEASRNPLQATTYGVGEMILDAVDCGCRKFIIGIGGSATNDGGLGMLQALGYRFYKEDSAKAECCPYELEHIVRIDDEKVDSRLKECSFEVACDVKNPLCGETGASYVFGPQKGADAAAVEYLDKSLQHFATVTADYMGADRSMEPGCGAAGGLGFAFLSYLHAGLRSGVDIILDTVLTESELEWADIVITGEGKMDAQTAMGKAPSGIAKRARAHGCAVIALAGSVDRENRMEDTWIDAGFSIVPGPCTLEEAMKKENASRNMRQTAEQIFSVIKAVAKIQASSL